MSMDQFYALREQQGWPLRRPPDKTFERALRRLPPPPPRTPGDENGEAPRADAPPDAAEPAADPAETVARAKRLAHDIVADLQRERLRRPRAFAPRAARELAAVARSSRCGASRRHFARSRFRRRTRTMTHKIQAAASSSCGMSFTDVLSRLGATRKEETAFLATLRRSEIERMLGQWELRGPRQRAPSWRDPSWTTWLFLGGRG